MTFVGDTSAAVKTATSALHRASSEMKIIGENITKSNLDGYTQKELVYRNNVINGHSAGLILEDVVSKVDPAQREIYWESLASDGYYGNMFNALQELDTDLGHPMKNNNLNVRLTEFKKALQQMTLKPEDATTRQNFVKSAARVADFIQDTAKKIKDFRNRFEHKIAEDVGRVNDLLKLLEGNNSAISFANGTGNPTADLVDIRDKNISALTELIGARKYTNSDDTVSIRIPGKTNLLDTTRAEIVTFNETTNLSPGMTSNPIMVNGVDITSMVGGSIQANRKVVEDLCVGYQEALDRFTEVFRDQVNAVSNRGVSSAPPNSMTGSRTGLAGATAFTGTGNVRVAVIDNTAGSEGTIIETLTIDLSLIVNHDGLRTAINGMTNASAAFTANGEFQLTATNANHGIVMVSESTAPEAQETMTGSNLGLSHYFGFQNLIETPGAFLGAADGIANTVTINSAFKTNDRLLPSAHLDLTKIAGEVAVYPGDNRNMLELMDLFSAQQTFNATQKMGPQISNFIEFAQDMYNMIANEISSTQSNAKDAMDESRITKEQYISRVGVNMKEMLMKAMEMGKYQGANIAVIERSDQMRQELINVGRGR